MKIRTITMGLNYTKKTSKETIEKTAEALQYIKHQFIGKHYDVQTIRVCTQPWHNYANTKKDLLAQVQRIHDILLHHTIDYFSIGPIDDSQKIPWLYDVLTSNDQCFCTTNICTQDHINTAAAWETAKMIKKLSTNRSNGFTNLRFAALGNISSMTPFFPASYHMGSSSFSIGLENSDLIHTSFKNCSSLSEASASLQQTCLEAYEPLEHIAEVCANKTGVSFAGIDVSVCSSIKKEESIASGFEELDLGEFGSSGTLAIAQMLTNVLQSLPIKKTGYNGLMLPVLEDYGLAEKVKKGKLSIQKLLLYSSVCGTGLDTIPLPGDISVKKLYAVLLDVAALSMKLKKPLSARLMPIPRKNKDDMTSFDFEYFVNTLVMDP